MKVGVIGLGNPFLTDDSAGVIAARLLKEALSGNPDVAVKEFSTGGLSLLDEISGFDRVVIIDAMASVTGIPGAIHRLSLSELERTWNTYSLHDMNLPAAIAVGRTIGMALPAEVMVWGIEGLDMETFSEEPTPVVAAAIPELVARVCSEVHACFEQLQGEAL